MTGKASGAKNATGDESVFAYIAEPQRGFGERRVYSGASIDSFLLNDPSLERSTKSQRTKEATL
jgi:hypothetical protein